MSENLRFEFHPKDNELVRIAHDPIHGKKGSIIISKRSGEWRATSGWDLVVAEHWTELVELVGENVFHSDGRKFTLFEANYNLTAEHF